MPGSELALVFLRKEAQRGFPQLQGDLLFYCVLAKLSAAYIDRLFDVIVTQEARQIRI